MHRDTGSVTGHSAKIHYNSLNKWVLYANPFLRFEQESGFLTFRKPSNNVVNYGYRTLVLQRLFKEGCAGMREVRLGAWRGSAWPVRYYPAYPRATATTHPARTVPGAAFPAPPGRAAAS